MNRTDTDDGLSLYHAGNGLFFERLESGDVRIEKRKEPRLASALIFDEVVSSNTWASIVAAVSSRGESGRTFIEAERLHNDVQ